MRKSVLAAIIIAAASSMAFAQSAAPKAPTVPAMSRADNMPPVAAAKKAAKKKAIKAKKKKMKAKKSKSKKK
jgi:hypothetical protein